MIDYASLLAQATPVTPSRKGGGGGRGRTSVPELRIESDSNGRPRISINTGLKRRFIDDGTFAPYITVSILDQLDRYGAGQYLFFFTFTDEATDDTVSVTNAFKDGKVISNNGSYITALTSIANSVGRHPQEYYGVFDSDAVKRLDDTSDTYVVTIPSKDQQELDELLQEDKKKVSEARVRASQRAIDKETATQEDEDANDLQVIYDAITSDDATIDDDEEPEYDDEDEEDPN